MNTFVINNAAAGEVRPRDQSARGVEVVGHCRREPPHPADCIAIAARDICSYGVDGVLLLCESLLQRLLVKEPDAWRYCATVARA